MHFVGLVSGGKDSIFSILNAMQSSHSLVCLAHLSASTEKDSYMFQSIGSNLVQKIAICMETEFITRKMGQSLNIDKDYQQTAGDEVEDLYELLKEVINRYPMVKGVSTGAILSSYQRIRIENVCERLGLTCLSYMWMQDQATLLGDMIDMDFNAILVKVAALGLSEKQLGLSLKQVHPKLVDLNNKYGLHLCGEGGEYETIVLDCPLYKKRIEIVESRVVKHGEDVWYLEILQVNLVDKESNPESRDFSQIVKTPRFEDHDLGLSLDAMAINLEKLSIVEPSPPVQSHSPTFTMINNFFAISGITSSAPSLSAQTTEIFSALLSILEFHKLGLTDLILITVHLPSMTSFTTFNAIYSSFFNLNPPARVTLSTSSTLQIDVLGSTSTLDHLHVKSISYWAPSNIGPYSQLVTCGNLGFMAGMIGLVPAQMELSNNEFCQAHASLCRVVEGFEENFLYKMVFVVEGVDVGVVKKLGKRMGVVRLKGLPKDARVEIQSVVGSGVDFKSEKWDGGFVDLARGEEMTIWNAGFRTVEDLSRLKVDWESVLSVRVFYTEDVRDSVKLAVESWAERNVSVTYVPVLEVDIGLKIGLNIYCFKT